MLNSIWTENIRIPAFPRQEQDLKTDILIVGGGMAGLLCQRLLTDAGADCVLIEADRILGGVTRNTTAKITSQHGLLYDKLIRQFGEKTARLYYDANEAALAKYRAFAERIDCGFEVQDSYVYEVGSSEKLGKELDALKKLNIPGEYVGASRLPVTAAGAIRFLDQGQFHPLKFGAGIAEGLRIYEDTRALEFAPDTVITNRGTITANKIIIATHFPILNKHGGYYLKMYQERSYVLALENATRVEGMYRDEAKSGLSLRNYGDLLLLGGGSHRTGENEGGKYDALRDAARTLFPGSREVAHWSAQDCVTVDRIPCIGQYARAQPRWYVATGFAKWGMTSAMVSARIIAGMIAGDAPDYADVFSPQRPVISADNMKPLLDEAGHALRNLAKVTPVPRCRHLGCELSWNPDEDSWDCPCHGSRYTLEGELLDGPAQMPLENH